MDGVATIRSRMHVRNMRADLAGAKRLYTLIDTLGHANSSKALKDEHFDLGADAVSVRINKRGNPVRAGYPSAHSRLSEPLGIGFAVACDNQS